MGLQYPLYESGRQHYRGSEGKGRYNKRALIFLNIYIYIYVMLKNIAQMLQNNKIGEGKRAI